MLPQKLWTELLSQILTYIIFLVKIHRFCVRFMGISYSILLASQFLISNSNFVPTHAIRMSYHDDGNCMDISQVQQRTILEMPENHFPESHFSHVFNFHFYDSHFPKFPVARFSASNIIPFLHFFFLLMRWNINFC